MLPVNISRLQPSRLQAIEDWPWLDQDVLRTSRSRQVCMTCHFFRHHPEPDDIPLLACHLCQPTSNTEPALCIINCYLPLVSRQDWSFPLSASPFRLIASPPVAALLGLFAIP